MKLSRHVICAIDDAEAGKFDAALLHACFTIDGTSKRLFPDEDGVGARYKKCVREYYWVIESMLGGGLNLRDTIFTNLVIKDKAPDFAEVIYEKFRNSHAHADEVPSEYEVIPSSRTASEWIFEKDRLHMPDRVIWALLVVAVFSKQNAGEKSDGDYYLSLGNERFLIRDWWGREDEFRAVAERYNKVKVKLDLGDCAAASSTHVKTPATVLIRQLPEDD